MLVAFEDIGASYGIPGQAVDKGNRHIVALTFGEILVHLDDRVFIGTHDRLEGAVLDVFDEEVVVPLLWGKASGLTCVSHCYAPKL